MNFGNLSTEWLHGRKEHLLETIDTYEKSLVYVRSNMVSRVYQFIIRKSKEEIHAIDAELFYRENQQ